MTKQEKVTRRPRQDRSHATVVRILTAAVDMIRESGGDGFTTNHIAARAGVSITSLYRFFPSKFHILRELHELWLEEVLGNMDRYAEENLGRLAWRAFFAGLGDTGTVDWLDDAAARRLWHLTAVTPELAEYNAAYDRQVAERLERYLRHYGSPLPRTERLAAGYLLNELHNATIEQTWAQSPAVARALRQFSAAAQQRILEACEMAEDIP